MSDFRPWQEAATAFLERDGNIARLTLNRPETLNAITLAGFEEIPRLARLADADPDIRALILTGAGRGFCSGADLKEVVAQRREARLGPRLPALVGGEVELLSGVQVPVIAALNGPAAGLGFGLALLCDLRIASDRAKLSEAHVKAGLAPSIAAWYLPRMIGLSKATEVVLLGRSLSAADALELGLVSQVVPHDELPEAAYQLALQVAELPAVAAIAAKAALQRGLYGSLDSVREIGTGANLLSRMINQAETAR